MLQRATGRHGSQTLSASACVQHARLNVRPMSTNLAYLDPGSSGMMLQMVGGMLAAVAVTLKLFWRHILEMLHIRARHEPVQTAEAHERDVRNDVAP